MKIAQFADSLARQYGHFFQGAIPSPGRGGKGGVRSGLQPAAVDAASQLKGEGPPLLLESRDQPRIDPRAHKLDDMRPPKTRSP
jgi:hypothetical protein